MQIFDPAQSRDLPDIAADLLSRLRAEAPRVHCLTNAVAQGFTANVLLALGTTPSMTMSADEVTAFVRGARALLVNLGTLDAGRRAVMDLGVAAANEAGLPWVLDPVKVERSQIRADYARALIARKPAAIRLNGGEFSALSGTAPARDTIMAYAQRHAVTIAMTGETDIVSNGAGAVEIANGHPLMTQVTAMGCAESAVIAAFLAIARDGAQAASAALLAYNVAGQIAAGNAHGPGSFAVEFLDALFYLDATSLRQYAQVS